MIPLVVAVSVGGVAGTLLRFATGMAVLQGQFIGGQGRGQGRATGQQGAEGEGAAHSVAAFFADPRVDEFVVHFTALEPRRDPGFLIGVSAQ